MKPKTKISIQRDLKNCRMEYKFILGIREQILASTIPPGRKVGYLFNNTFNLLSIQNRIDQAKAKL